jgi:hypothetical protein
MVLHASAQLARAERSLTLSVRQRGRSVLGSFVMLSMAEA